MSIVEGFAGMHVRDGVLHFKPQIPAAWDSYCFKVNFKGQVLTVTVSKEGADFSIEKGAALEIMVENSPLMVQV
jgi:maltose phosphorylase